MEGYWISYNYYPDGHTGQYLYIHDGKSSVYYSGNGDNVNVKGRAKIHDEKLRIKNETLKISVFPAYSEKGDYRMIANGYNLIKSAAPRISTTNITTSEATLIIHLGDYAAGTYFLENAESFDVDYKLQADSAWTTINWQPNINHIITGLLPASTYECRMKANYPWEDSEFCPTITFTTQ